MAVTIRRLLFAVIAATFLGVGILVPVTAGASNNSTSSAPINGTASVGTPLVVIGGGGSTTPWATSPDVGPCGEGLISYKATDSSGQAKYYPALYLVDRYTYSLGGGWAGYVTIQFQYSGGTIVSTLRYIPGNETIWIGATYNVPSHSGEYVRGRASAWVFTAWESGVGVRQCTGSSSWGPWVPNN